MSKYAKEVNECLLRMQNGDASQLKDLYELTVNHLRLMVNVFLINKADCDDVVIETYMRASKYIHSFDASQDGYNWLCTIARNLVREFNRNEAEHVKYLSEFERDEIAADFDMEQVDSKIDLSLATRNLDDKNKYIFRKRYYYGETLEQIAKELGVMKVAIFKRLQNINKEVEKYYKKK